MAGRLGDLARGDGLLGSGRSDHKNHLLNLFGRAGDGRQAAPRPLRLVQASLHSCAIALRQIEGRLGLILNVADGSGNLLGGSLGVFSQAANLAGHHRESAAMLPGAGSFNRSVESQQVGLLADFLDQADHLADILGATG